MRYNFSLDHSPKISIQAPKIILVPHKYFQHITQLGLSQIFPILLQNLGLHKYFSYHYQKWTTKLYHLYKGPNSFILWAKSKKPKHSYQVHCYMTLLKAYCYITLLQSPLLHNTLTKSVATWNSEKPVATWHS